nr:MAG: movement protein [Plant associated polerovirus 1]
MAEDEVGVLAAGLGGATQWLWSKPLGSHNAEDDEDEYVVSLLEEAELEDEGRARHSYFQKTTSRAVTPEVSLSGRVYQTAQRSVLEYSRPTIAIKSQWSSWSSSPRPLPPLQVRSLTNLIPTAKPQAYNPISTSLVSRKADAGHSLPAPSTEQSGTPRTSTSSGYFTKGMDLAPRQRAPSGSPSSAQLRIRNR